MAKNVDVNVIVTRGGMVVWQGTVKAPAGTPKATLIYGEDANTAENNTLMKKVAKETDLREGDAVALNP